MVFGGYPFSTDLGGTTRNTYHLGGPRCRHMHISCAVQERMPRQFGARSVQARATTHRQPNTVHKQGFCKDARFGSQSMTFPDHQGTAICARASYSEIL